MCVQRDGGDANGDPHGYPALEIGPLVGRGSGRDRQCGITAVSRNPGSPACAQLCSKNAKTRSGLSGQ